MFKFYSPSLQHQMLDPSYSTRQQEQQHGSFVILDFSQYQQQQPTPTIHNPNPFQPPFLPCIYYILSPNNSYCQQPTISPPHSLYHIPVQLLLQQRL